jgi:hypothetical protein
LFENGLNWVSAQPTIGSVVQFYELLLTTDDAGARLGVEKNSLYSGPDPVVAVNSAKQSGRKVGFWLKWRDGLNVEERHAAFHYLEIRRGWYVHTNCAISMIQYLREL